MAGPAERGVREWIAEWVARAAGVERSVVSATRPFDEYGLASRDIVALSGELSEEYGVAIPADAVYEFPTIAVLAAHTAALAAAGAGSAVNPSPDGGRGGQAGHEVAVVGVGCRFPGGVRGPRDLWRLLLRGGSAIADVPPGRWRSFAAGDPATAALLAAPAIARGGFLDDIAAFDAGFFGISPREAELMDPQQRIALEVVWEALDHAGIAPRSLVGSRAGVFTGVATVDYVPDGLAGFDGWGATGASMGVVASRISYQLDVRGPSVAVDTACSSSLVAVHMAKESLARGESDIALAGGVNLLVSPAVSIAFSSAGVLAPDGRCKTFDAAADGYVRSEGCGFVVLKRLDDARRDGDRVLAVIAGSATNANGRSNGLMAPHPGAQEELLRLAYRDAGIDPAQVQVVEAHGTGTALGDAIEVSAIAAVTMPDRRPGRPLLLGAVKTNLGHLEAAAGVAGFVKTVIAMQRGTVPPTVGLRRLNPALGLDTLPARVVTEAVEWPAAAGSRIAGVSSFGFGGVNAHVVLRDDRDDRDEREGRDGAGRRRRASAPAPGGRSGPVVLPVSAGSPESLRAEAASLREWLDGPGAATPLTALGSALATRRSTGQTRAAVIAANPAEARAGLDAVAGGGAHPQVCHGRVRDGCEPVFVFSGHGSQSPGMAALLLESDETFAAAIAELEPLVAAEAGLSVRAALTGREEASDVGVVQPLLFCVQIGLARTWQARGVVPAAVIGHSMGEVAAAVVAGSLSLEDGVRVVCRRARLMRRLSGRGGMAAIPLGVRDAAEAVARAGLDGEVQIAVESAPAATVVAGTIRGIEKFMAACGESGIDAMRVDVDVASHSGAVDPILADLAVELADVRPRPAGIPMFSTVEGRDPAVPHRPDPAYWVDNLRQRVALPAAVRAAGERGHSVFVEVSPHPVLTGPVRATLEDAGVAEPEVFPTLHRETPDPTAFALAAARLHCLGHDIAWPAVTAEAERIELPVRAWDHRTSFWREPAPATRAAAGAHPLLGDPVRPADQERRVLWTRTLDGDALGPQHEHRVAGVPVMLASTLIEQVLAAATGAGLDDVVLRDLVLHTPVEVRPGTALQTVCDLDGGGESATIRLFHRDAGAGRWVQHATARAHRDRALVAALARVEGEQMPGASEPVDPAGFYRDLAAHGLEFGPGLRRLRTLRVAGGRAVLGLESVAPREASAAVDAGLLATTLQGVAAVMPAPDGAAPVVITGTGTVVLAAGAAGPDRATVELVDGAVGRTARAVLWAGDTAVGLLDDIRLGGTTAGAGSGRGVAGGAGTAPLHRVSWTVEPRAGAPRSERWLLAGGPEELAGALRSCGVDAARVPPGEHTRLAGLLRDGRFDRLVHLGALAVDGDRPSDAAMLTEQVLGVLRVLDRQPEAAPVLHIATRRAVLAGEGDTGNAAQAVLWGLGRTVALEHPERWGGLLDLDDGGVGRWASALVAEWAGGGSGGQACLRGGQRLVPRLRSCAPAAVPPSAVVDDGRAHLVVGGTGRLGPHVLDALIDEGARCLVVASRSGTAPVPPRPDRGAVRVVGVPVDIRDREAVRTLFGRFGADLPPLGTVVHAAFAQSIAPLSRVDAATVAEMHEVKIAGLALLHELAAAHGAREVVCLSSTTGLFGSVGLGHYAAASCYLDVFAGNRTGGPTPVRALLLGPCADGLAGTPEAEHVIRSGFRLMDGARAVATGMRARDVVRPPVVVDADWARLGLALATATESPLLRDVGPPDPGSAAEIPPPPPSDPGTDPARVLREEIRRLVAEAMGVAEDAIGVQQNLFTLGMDSLMSLAVVRGIRTALGHELHPRDIRDNPTVAALAEHVARGAAGPAGAPRDRRPTT